MNSDIKQNGSTLVELLIIVAIVGIIGGITGIFLLKYLPEYNLRSAVNTFTQDIRSTQMNALKRLRQWEIRINTANHTYQIIDSVDSNFDDGDDIIQKTVDLKQYTSMIRFGAGTSSRVRYDEEGLCESPATILLTNSEHSVSTINILRTGAIRATR